MKTHDPFENPEQERLQLFVYLIPILGFFPALWTLYRHQGTRQQQAVSRLVIVLAFSWLTGLLLLEVGYHNAESFTLAMLLTSSLLTTSYFIVSLGLMIRVWKRQPIWLPGLSRIAEKELGKHLP
ncbi:MAG: hypothetical protein ACKPEN_13635 [Planktothrix sp.]|uniref:hypothetical protein n=1 Tax=Planktothrix sp. TaxID=3088171 RepID=UPI0038D3EBC7